MPSGSERALLNFFREPVFVLTPSGVILQANAGAEQVIGSNWGGRDFPDYLSSPDDAFRNWLKRCSGTTSPLVGSLVLRKPDGSTKRFRTFGARLREDGEQVRIAVRCADADSDGFSLLKKEVGQLNAEARERRHKQAVLEEALRNNEVLLQELNHRVKNNIQLMVGLFAAAIRETDSEEVKKVLQAASNQLLAVGTAQDLMYEAQQMTTIPAAPFVTNLAEAVAASLGPDLQMEISAAEGKFSNDMAFPLALILNELLTNAVKHGLPGGRGKIRIALDRHDNGFSLTVHDNGPGIAAEGPPHRASGLGLVRGLCRQIGGTLLVENDGGARCTVRFEDRQTDERR
jgi:two-component sensor histidine kinase